MLVNVVEFVKGPQGIIPSLVRLYDINNQLTDVFTKSLYFSFIDMTYKFIPSISQGKMAAGYIPALALTIAVENIP